VVVVLIITVFAALAIPSAVGQMRDRRVQEAARTIAIVYREARLRALGRGSAMLVRFSSGRFTVHEARVGAPIGGEAGCAALPVSSCLNTDWAGTTQPVVGGYQVAASGETSDMTLTLSDSADAALTTLDICFTPLGRAFSRTNIADGAFTPLAEAYVTTVARTSGLTRPRQVVMMPNGTARLFTP
jgi:type IV fimbrial biogenesis protein FimT